MPSQDFSIRTKGVRNLKKQLIKSIPFRFHQQAIRDFKDWMLLVGQKDKFSVKLKPLYDEIFTDHGVDVSSMSNAWEDLDAFGKICKVLENNSWRVVALHHSYSKKDENRLAYHLNGRLYILPLAKPSKKNALK
jgi:hypothetical protein